MTFANFIISPAEAVQLLGAMGVVATLESIGTAQGTRPDEPSDFMTSPFYVHLVMLIMGMLLGMLVRDCTREMIPCVRRVFRAYFRRIQVQHRQQRPGDNLERFVVNTERRLDNLEIRMDASARREYHRDREAGSDSGVTSQSRRRSTSLAGSSGRSRRSSRGDYVPPVTEDTEPTPPAPLHEVAADALNFEQLADAVDIIEEAARQTADAPVVIPVPEPIQQPQAPVATVEMPPVQERVNSTNIAPLPNVPESALNTGIALDPPCVFTSQYGRRIHLYMDGSCLSGANVVDGRRNLSALPVCLTCQARFRRGNAEAVASAANR
jgi:hypothetical protein